LLYEASAISKRDSVMGIAFSQYKIKELRSNSLFK